MYDQSLVILAQCTIASQLQFAITICHASMSALRYRRWAYHVLTILPGVVFCAVRAVLA